MNIHSIGNVQIRCFTDGEVAFSPPLSQLIPDSTEAELQRFRTLFPEVFAGPNSWKVHFGCYLIMADGQTILVDTGIGPEPSQFLGGVPGKLFQELEKVGIEPSDIDIVFLTHAHADHIGWNLYPDGSRRFPNARYVISQAEWDSLPERVAQHRAGLGEINRNLMPLGKLESLQLLSGESGITDSVMALETPGHTPGHMSLLITSAGEKALIAGDAIVHPAFVTRPEWRLNLDSDKELACQTRQRLLDRLEADDMQLIGCHFPSPGIGGVIRVEGKRYWRAL